LRTRRETNAINRVLQAWGLGTLDDSGVAEGIAKLVRNHDHFRDLLKICEPELRREMYESMKSHLRFKAKPLEDYVIAAKEHAESHQLLVLDEDGMLQPYTVPMVVVEVPEYELMIICSKCGKAASFLGDRPADAVQNMRHSSWAFDESVERHHLCPECLEDSSAMDQASS